MSSIESRGISAGQQPFVALLELSCAEKNAQAMTRPSDRLKVLTVGDGDLTLSLALARAYGDTQLDLTASTLLRTLDDLTQTYDNAQHVLQELEERNVPVWFGLDATQLHRLNDNYHNDKDNDNKNDKDNDKDKDNNKFDVVMFHHPHLGLDSLLDNEPWHAQRHYILLAHYLWAAKHILTDRGRIHLCLCGTQPRTWRLHEAAAKHGLTLLTNQPTSTPIHTWLVPLAQPLPVQPHFPAPRKFRNGKLGSKHALGKYGYQHRRTHGDHGASNTTSDISVAGSVHLVFGIDANTPTITPSQHDPMRHLDLECCICGETFDCTEALNKHLQSPAIPDSHTSNNTFTNPAATATATATTLILPAIVTPILQNDQTKETHDQGLQGHHTCTQSHTQPQATQKNPIMQYQAAVTQQHDGKRLRWYLRQDIMNSRKPMSKKQCDQLIKQGHVLLNSHVVTDNSRILKCGDSIQLLQSLPHTPSMSHASTKPSTVQLIFQQHPIVVAFKPVGIRTLGAFSGNTLEMKVSAQLGSPYKSISKLDTGCPGLCLLTHQQESSNVQLTHIFTALVHGCAYKKWNQPTQMELHLDQARRWKHSGSKRTINEVSTTETITTITLQCLESIPSLSTIQIETTSKSSSLCSAICFLLRKTGHAVLNDRFCKQEYLELPRSMRNLIKERLCIGCYEIKIDGVISRINKTTPERLSAVYWEQHFNYPITSADT